MSTLGGVRRDRMDRTVLPLIEMRRSDIAEICRRFHVNRLEVFGSAGAVWISIRRGRMSTCLSVTSLATNLGSPPIKTCVMPWRACWGGRSILFWKQP